MSNKCNKCNYFDNTLDHDDVCSNCKRNQKATIIKNLLTKINEDYFLAKRRCQRGVIFELDFSIINGREVFNGIDVYLSSIFSKKQNYLPNHVKIFSTFISEELLNKLIVAKNKIDLIDILDLDELRPLASANY